MKSRAILLALVLPALLFLPDRASGGGIDLSWNACGTAGLGSIVFECDGTGGPYQMFATVQPSADLENFDSAVATMCVSATYQSPLLPAFWQFGFGECSEGSLGAFGSPPSTGCASAIDPWPHSSLQYIDWGPITGTRRRMTVTHARAFGSSPYPLLHAGATYFMFGVMILEDNAANCVGCDAPVALEISELTLYSTTAFAMVESAPGLRNNAIGVNGAFPNTCSPSPAPNATWGRLKSLYR